VLGGQLDVATAYRLVSDDARAVMGLPAGDTGDQVAVRSRSLQEALATTTEDRIVLRAGRVVDRTRVTRDDVPTGGDRG
jgi:cytosine deaminase